MSWNIEYYETEGGNSPVQEFIDSLPDQHQAKITQRIDLLAEKGTLLKEPYVKNVKEKIWELRILAKENIHRIFYFAYTGRKMVLLHGFTKKTEKTPKKEIDIAEERIKDYIRRNKDD